MLKMTCAPELSKPKQPKDWLLSKEPGNTYTSRPKSLAKRAVINAPERSGASMMIYSPT